MSTIAVLIDPEEGHMLPSFWLSRHLKDFGHRICYLGLPSVEGLVRNQGFEFIQIPSESLPKEFYSYFGPLVRGEVLDEVIDVLRPDAALILSLYYTAGLAIHYRYRLPVVFFTPQLKKGNRIIECESVEHDLLNVKSGLP